MNPKALLYLNKLLTDNFKQGTYQSNYLVLKILTLTIENIKVDKNIKMEGHSKHHFVNAIFKLS
ncbi:hypothetical protein CW304_18410 [Bacillus sp. UFRGS-B20]|nr:hypothetical protein CW304_18410 [Bacillus sp. UFRGS-B20]